MKTIDKVLSWLILVALVSVVVLQIVKSKTSEDAAELPSVMIDDVKDVFPEAVSVQYLDTSYFQVNGVDNQVLGIVMLSSPYSDAVKGYAGRTPLQIAFDTDGKILNVKLLKNNETPSFIRSVAKAGYFESWNGMTVDEVLNSNVDAVSGATYSSRGIAESLKARMAVAARQQASGNHVNADDLVANVAILVVLVMALVCFFVPRKTKTLRLVTLLLSVLILGLWRNALPSLYLYYGWLTNGVSFATQWVLVLLTVLAIALPLFTGKAFYCMYLCPMGALQEFVGKACRKKVKLSNKVAAVLLAVRKLYLLTILVLVAMGVLTNLVFFEAFSVFSVRSLTLYSAFFAALILLASLFVTRAWCRFLCPTGLLFDLARRRKVKRMVEKDGL